MSALRRSSDTQPSAPMMRLGTALLGGIALERPWTPGMSADAGRTFIPLPSVRNPQLLLPAGTACQQAAALERPDSVASGTRRGALAGARRALALGAGRTLRSRAWHLAEALPTIVEHVAAQMPDQAVVYAPATGPVRPNQKPVGRLIAPDGATLGWLKIGTEGATSALVQHEQAVLRALPATMPAHIHVPELLAGGPWQSIAFHVTKPPIRPTGPPNFDPQIACLEAMTRPSRRRDLVATSDAWNDLTQRAYAHLSAAHLNAFEKSAETLQATPLDLGRVHGDWSPWNRHCGAREAWIWDWERARADGPIGMDVVHNAVQVSLVKWPADWVRALRAGAASLQSNSASLGLSAEGERSAMTWYLGEMLVRYSETAFADMPAIAAARHHLFQALAAFTEANSFTKRTLSP